MDVNQVVNGGNMKKAIAIAILALFTFTASAQTISLPDNTAVNITLSDTLSSATAEVGDRVRFTVEQDVLVGNDVVIKAGTLALGHITLAEHKKWAGRGGKLALQVDSTTGVDGRKIDLSASPIARNGASHVAGMTTGIVITSFFTFGGASLFLLMHGKDIVIAAGKTATAYTVGNQQVGPAVQ
jgi:hypothetical protein